MFRHNKDEDSTSKKVERMYDKYRNLMFKEANNILKDLNLAEDAVQQSFVKVISNINKINEEDETKTRNFLVIICRNTAIDLYKNRLYLNKNTNSLEFEMEDDEKRNNYVCRTIESYN